LKIRLNEVSDASRKMKAGKDIGLIVAVEVWKCSRVRGPSMVNEIQQSFEHYYFPIN